MGRGNKSNVVAEVALAAGVLFLAVCVGAGFTPSCGYSPSGEILGATGAIFSLRSSKAAKVIGLGVAFSMITLELWVLKDHLFLLGEGRFREFFGW